MSNHMLAMRLRAIVDVLNSTPSTDPDDKYALTAIAADLLEAATRLDQNRERQKG